MQFTRDTLAASPRVVTYVTAGHAKDGKVAAGDGSLGLPFTPIRPARALARPTRRGSSERPRTPSHPPAATWIGSPRIPGPTCLLLTRAYARQNPSMLRSPATACPPPAPRRPVPEAEIRRPLSTHQRFVGVAEGLFLPARNCRYSFSRRRRTAANPSGCPRRIALMFTTIPS